MNIFENQIEMTSVNLKIKLSEIGKKGEMLCMLWVNKTYVLEIINN